jgi:hypothetical protein
MQFREPDTFSRSPTQRQNRGAVATGSNVPKAQETEEALPAPPQTVRTHAMTRLTSLVKTILECTPD